MGSSRILFEVSDCPEFIVEFLEEVEKPHALYKVAVFSVEFLLFEYGSLGDLAQSVDLGDLSGGAVGSRNGMALDGAQR